jgi:hypothetical protein
MSKSIEQQIRDGERAFNRYAYQQLRQAHPELPLVPEFVKEEQNKVHQKVHPESEGTPFHRLLPRSRFIRN